MSLQIELIDLILNFKSSLACWLAPLPNLQRAPCTWHHLADGKTSDCIIYYRVGVLKINKEWTKLQSQAGNAIVDLDSLHLLGCFLAGVRVYPWNKECVHHKGELRDLARPL